MKRLTKHLTPATIMAFVALVFAVTGGAFPRAAVAVVVACLSR